MMPNGHSDRAALLNTLSIQLRHHYERTAEIDKLEEAIQTARQAVSMPNNSDLAGTLNTLGSGISVRYKRTGVQADLDEAIQTTKRAVEVVPLNDNRRVGFLSNLGIRLGDLYLKSKNIADLEEAIEILGNALEVTPRDHQARPLLLNNLGIRLGHRYHRTEKTTDLDEWINMTRESIELIPETHPSHSPCVANLGLALGKRYERTGSMDDLEDAIRIAKQAVDTVPHNHTRRGQVLFLLSNRIGERFKRTGTRIDLEEAIVVARQSTESTPNNHSNRSDRVHNLAIRLRQRYQFSGMISDLEEAIKMSREAVMADSLSYMSQAGQLNALGINLGLRYERTGTMADLDESIQIARQAAQGVPLGHVYQSGLLNSLSIRLGGRYMRTKSRKDLDEAIHVAQEAIELTPKDHPEREGRLHTLSIHLGLEFNETKAISTLKNALQISRQIVEATPAHFANRSERLDTLATQLGNWYRETREIPDLEAAITMARRAVESTPSNHPDRAGRLRNLGAFLVDRYDRTGVEADLGEANDVFQCALSQDNAPTMVRVQSGLKLLETCSRPQELFEALSLAVSLIPRLTLRSLETADKQHILGQIAGLASSAAAAALQVKKSPYIALSLLEQGRGILSASLEEMRTDVDELYENHSRLAERFDFLRSELDSPIIQKITSSDEYDDVPLQGGGTDRRYDVGTEMEALIAEIRQRPGFEDFLGPPSERNIRSAARYGPIVIVNVSKQRCDTLIVEPNRIWTLPLPKLSKETIDEMAQDYRLEGMGVLRWLWDVVTSPVLDGLGFKHALGDVSCAEWPRIWWIPTGALTVFPLHASGHHGNGSLDTVLDRVISSYSSSVRAIIAGRQHPKAPSSPIRMLLVAMARTPGRAPLSSAAEEITQVCDIFTSESLETIQLHQPAKVDVINHIDRCTVFHFAGHGSVHKWDPAKSQICLEDWIENPLTVADLLKMNLRRRSPFLAYLSACGTGRIKEEKFFDESIHLVRACQVAGFRHVIGTLWEVNDRHCVDMARLTYQEIMRKGLTDDSVSWGLHVATRQLRDDWLGTQGQVAPRPHRDRSVYEDGASLIENVRGEETNQVLRKWHISDSDDEDASPDGPLRWVPYVHFGV
ncbi:putative CHAT domain-containing protein [Seiridium unicorne]|uniref:CHAT domain-containing protein n=1 Tax=Seiridium unicorne TaxID=138068 RepID=A0ABR2UWD1_9PEZI